MIIGVVFSQMDGLEARYAGLRQQADRARELRSDVKLLEVCVWEGGEGGLACLSPSLVSVGLDGWMRACM